MTNTHCLTKFILLCCKAFLRNITYISGVFLQYDLFFTYTNTCIISLVCKQIRRVWICLRLFGVDFSPGRHFPSKKGN